MIYKYFLALTVFALAAPSALAQNERPGPVLERMGLTGTWAPSCSAPPSKTNPYVTYYVEKQGLVRRRFNLGPGDGAGEANTTIDVVRQLSPNSVRVRQRLDDPRWGKQNGTTFDIVIEITDGRLRPVSSVRGDGTEMVKNGIIVASGQPTTVVEKCKTTDPAANMTTGQAAAATAPAAPAGPKPGPVLQSAGLTGVWAPSCTSPPSMTNVRVTYYVESDGTVRFSGDYGPQAPPNLVATYGSGTIEGARRLSPTMLEVQVRANNGELFTTTHEISGGHARRVLQLKQDGTATIRDGKIVATGQPDPPREKCSN